MNIESIWRPTNTITYKQGFHLSDNSLNLVLYSNHYISYLIGKLLENYDNKRFEITFEVIRHENIDLIIRFIFHDAEYLDRDEFERELHYVICKNIIKYLRFKDNENEFNELKNKMPDSEIVKHIINKINLIDVNTGFEEMSKYYSFLWQLEGQKDFKIKNRTYDKQSHNNQLPFLYR